MDEAQGNSFPPAFSGSLCFQTYPMKKKTTRTVQGCEKQDREQEEEVHCETILGAEDRDLRLTEVGQMPRMERGDMDMTWGTGHGTEIWGEKRR